MSDLTQIIKKSTYIPNSSLRFLLLDQSIDGKINYTYNSLFHPPFDNKKWDVAKKLNIQLATELSYLKLALSEYLEKPSERIVKYTSYILPREDEGFYFIDSEISPCFSALIRPTPFIEEVMQRDSSIIDNALLFFENIPFYATDHPDNNCSRSDFLELYKQSEQHALELIGNFLKFSEKALLFLVAV